LLTKPLDNFEVVLRINNLLENRFLRMKLQGQNELLEQQVGERTAQLEETLHQLQSTQEQIVKQERLRALGMMAGRDRARFQQRAHDGARLRRTAPALPPGARAAARDGVPPAHVSPRRMRRMW
jgi:hypothetical protein